MACRINGSLASSLFISGGGSMVGALCGSTQREPVVVGKPSTFMMEYVANKYVTHILSFFFSSYLFYEAFSLKMLYSRGSCTFHCTKLHSSM